LTSEEEKLIFRRLFSGFDISETAGLVGASHQTVRNKKQRFVTEAKREDLLRTARSYGVERQVEDLMKLSAQLRESEASWQACLEGVKLHEKLRALGVDATGLEPFVTGIYQEALAQDLAPGEVLDLGLEMRRLKAETGKSYTLLVEESRTLIETNERLREENEI